MKARSNGWNARKRIFAQPGISRDGAFFRNALFLRQQCAEKAIKGFLTFNETTFSKTHSISALADLVTKYADIMRYPGVPYESDAGEIDSAIALAESVLTAVTGKIR